MGTSEDYGTKLYKLKNGKFRLLYPHEAPRGAKLVRNQKKKRKASLTIRGSKQYISYMSKHLKEEHPSTRRRMKVRGIKKR